MAQASLFLYAFHALAAHPYPILTSFRLFCPLNHQGGLSIEPPEAWMLIVGLLCIVYAGMVVLWVVAWRKAPERSSGRL
jgi:hypothetical protein